MESFKWSLCMAGSAMLKTMANDKKEPRLSYEAGMKDQMEKQIIAQNASTR